VIRLRPGRASAIAVCLLLGAAPAARSVQPDIYPAPAQAKTDLAAALAASAASHKRIILDFGGNWCTDCHVLDRYFHDPANLPILDAGYILVHVNVGRMNENVDIAERYKIPLRKGVPALAVLDERGDLLYSQTGGEFQAMRGTRSADVRDFLLHWQRPGA